MVGRERKRVGVRTPKIQFLCLERDDFSSNRHPALSFCLSMISAQTLRVCREGKPVPTFPDHALVRDPPNFKLVKKETFFLRLFFKCVQSSFAMRADRR